MQRDPLTIKGKGVMTTYFLTIHVSCVKCTCHPASAVQLLVHLYLCAPSFVFWQLCYLVGSLAHLGQILCTASLWAAAAINLQAGHSSAAALHPRCCLCHWGRLWGGQHFASMWPAAASMPAALAAACRLIITPTLASAYQAATTPLLMLLGLAVSRTAPTAARPEEAASARAVAAVQTLQPAIRPRHLVSSRRAHPHPLTWTCLPQASFPTGSPGSALTKAMVCSSLLYLLTGPQPASWSPVVQPRLRLPGGYCQASLFLLLIWRQAAARVMLGEL